MWAGFDPTLEDHYKIQSFESSIFCNVFVEAYTISPCIDLSEVLELRHNPCLLRFPTPATFTYLLYV